MSVAIKGQEEGSFGNELLCILTVVINTQTYTCDKIAFNQIRK